MTKTNTRLVAISGAAGSGKSTAADALVHAGWVQVAQAQPMKRFCYWVFEFTSDQLHGPSESRNSNDVRYDSPAEWYAAWTRFRVFAPAWLGELGVGDEPGVLASLGRWFSSLAHDPLSPRAALQSFGAWGRSVDDALWTRAAVWHSRRLLAQGKHVVIPDIRLRSELDAFANEGALTVRIVRPGAGLTGEAGQDRTETEMAGIPDEAFDVVLKNDGTVADIGRRMLGLCYENSDGG